MLHPDCMLKYINHEIGYGIFATKPIPKGTITYIKDDLELVIDPASYKNLNPALKQMVDKYSYRDESNNRIVSWDLAKYMNHCCQCNTMTTKWGFEIAIRDIEAEEEITDEYGLFIGDEILSLNCGKKGCRQIIQPSDKEIYGPEWNHKIDLALEHFFEVQQPLSYLVQDTIISALKSELGQPILESLKDLA